MENIIYFLLKQATQMRRPTVLGRPFQLVLPAQPLSQRFVKVVHFVEANAVDYQT
jgi:hypothetical protein